MGAKHPRPKRPHSIPALAAGSVYAATRPVAVKRSSPKGARPRPRPSSPKGARPRQTTPPPKYVSDLKRLDDMMIETSLRRAQELIYKTPSSATYTPPPPPPMPHIPTADEIAAKLAEKMKAQQPRSPYSGCSGWFCRYSHQARAMSRGIRGRFPMRP